MQKLLLVLLIAFAATATVKVETEDLQSWWDDIWGGITNFFNKLTKKAREIYQWLVDNGYWDIIVSTAKTAGSYAAIAACTAYTGQAGLCTTVVNLLVSLIP